MTIYFNTPPSGGQRGALTLSQKIISATVEIGISVGISALLLYTFKSLSGTSISDLLDPSRLKPEAGAKGAERRLEDILERRMGKKVKEGGEGGLKVKLTLNSYEIVIAESVLDPSTLTTKFSSIGGIDTIKSSVYELCVLPLLRPDIFTSANVDVTKGVLLYGKPGTGKTMIAKAIANEGSAVFVNVKLSVIMNKYFGESNKMVSGVFSLARKLAPSLIFIDEIDTFLKQRDDSAEALGSMKSEFLTMWDGVNEGDDNDGIVMVMGATNRPYDVDQAILRRLPRQFEIPLPSAEGRLDIIKKMVKDDDLDGEATRFLEEAARRTEGFSGSDLREFVRCAKMERVTEITGEFSRRRVSGLGGGDERGLGRGGKIRRVCRRDFERALTKCSRTGEKARAYREKDELRDGREGARQEIDANQIMKMMAMMMGGGGGRPQRGGGGGGGGGASDPPIPVD